TRLAVPQFRFLHYANTLGGSSGGPCFDRSFAFFGMHQGVWTNGPHNSHITNRGVPILGVLNHIRQTIDELPALDPSENPIWRLGEAENQHPVIGTTTFQALVGRSTAARKPRLVTIAGNPGSGKTFLVTLLGTILPDGGHLKVTLDAGAISTMNATQLAERICQEAGASPPAITPVSAINSTPSAWLKDEVLTKVRAALDAARRN